MYVADTFWPEKCRDVARIVSSWHCTIGAKGVFKPKRGREGPFRGLLVLENTE